MAVATRKTGSGNKTTKRITPKGSGIRDKPKNNPKPQGGGDKNKPKTKPGDKKIKAYKALTPNQIKRRAKQTSKQAFASTRIQLDSEEKRLNAQQKRRQADAVQFQNWLTNRQAEFDIQGDAADAALQQGQAQRMAELAANFAQSENTGLDAAKSASISNVNIADHSGLDMESESGRAGRLGAVQALELAKVSLNANSMRNAISQNNMAMLAAMRNQENAEYGSAMADLRTDRLKMGAEQRDTFLKTKTELEQQELSKADSRTARNQANKKLELEKDGLKIEWYKAKSDVKIAIMNNASDERIAALKAQADLALQKLKGKQDAASDGRENGGKPDVDETDIRARKKLTREINADIGNAIGAVKTNATLKKYWKHNDKHGMSKVFSAMEIPQYLIPIVFDLMGNGKLSRSSRESLRGVGAYPKHIKGNAVERPRLGGPGDAHSG